MEKTYNWKRFWYKRGESEICTENGYLIDPEPEYMFFHKEKLKLFSEMDNESCLVLLGEPGIGKSFSLKEAVQTRKALNDEDVFIIYEDLKAFSSETSIYRNIFDSPRFQKWKGSTNKLYLYLDSLDECISQIKTLPDLLLRELKDLDHQRLFLRIACRSARWPTNFEDDLISFWDLESDCVYHLAPLRRCDISKALEVEKIPSEQFLLTIEDLKVVPLAVKPITLKLLIKSYKACGKIAKSRNKLFESGCKELTKETISRSMIQPESFMLSELDKFHIAARIAAVSMFSQKFIISLDQNLFSDESNFLQVSEIEGGFEGNHHERIEINRAALLCTLNTGLFVTCGQNLFTWSHLSYCEYLAAYYLSSSKMDSNHLFNLLIHPHDPEERIVDQLHQTAAWIAIFRPDIFIKIAQIDPFLLLKSDVTKADDKVKFDLVQSIINQFQEEKIIDDDWTIQVNDYGKLDNSRLVSQIKPYLLDPLKRFLTRRFVIDLVGSCQVDELFPDLVNLALDQNEMYSLRIRASWWIARSQDDTQKKKLLPLALGLAGDDPDDELKGFGLEAVWPKFISAEQMFSLLDPPKCPNLWGSYRGFLSNDLTTPLETKDILYALKWVENLPYSEELQTEYKSLIKRIIARAWKELDDENVIDNFETMILSRLKKHDGFRYCLIDKENDDLYKKDHDKRHRLIYRILKTHTSLQNSDVSIKDLFNYRDPIVINDDIPWILDQIKIAETKSSDSDIWIDLLRELLRWFPFDYTNEILTAYHQSKKLQEEFNEFFEPIIWDSPLANRLKTAYYENMASERTGGKRDRTESLSSDEFFQFFFSHVANNNHVVWMNLAFQLKFDEQDVICRDGFGSHQEDEIAWSKLSEPIKEKLIACSELSLSTIDPKSEEWFLENNFRYDALALYVSLQLLGRVKPKLINSIPVDVWKKSTPIILRSPFNRGEKTSEIHESLILRAYKASPNTFVHWFLQLLEHEDSNNQSIYSIHRIKNCFDEYLVDHILEKLKKTEFSSGGFSHILDLLLKTNHQKPIIFALELLNKKPKNDKESELHRIAAKSLFKFGDSNTWTPVWKSYFFDNELGKDFVIEIARESSYELRSVPQGLSEEQLSALFIWLEEHFPSSEDPDIRTDRIHKIEWRESIKDLKSSVFNTLRAKGSKEACSQIERIIEEFPEMEWLRWNLVIAKRKMRIQTWEPITPQDLIQLVQDKSKRTVRNESDLLEVVIESLKRLEAKMQCTVTPLADCLWNKNEPKNEIKLSDYVKVHLSEDIKNQNIIVNREVEIASAKEMGIGERIDILVEAFSKSSTNTGSEESEKLSLVIEVKGSWNRDVLTGLNQQLLERYLKKTGLRTGLYIVGYYLCDAWDQDSSKFRKTPKELKTSLHECREFFKEQVRKQIPTNYNVESLVLDLSLRK